MRSQRNSWTRERVIGDIKSYAAAGRELNSRAMESHCLPLAAAARRLFGSVREAIKQAGLEYVEPSRVGSNKKPSRWNREVVLVELRAMAQDGRLSASAVKYRSDGLYPATRREYGTVQAAIEAAGLIFERKSAPRGSKPKPKPIQKTPEVVEPPRRSRPLTGITRPAFETSFHRHTTQGVELNRIVSPLSVSEAQRLGSGR